MWDRYLVTGIAELVLWTGVLSLSFIKSEKLIKYITIASIFLLVVQTGGFISLLYSSPAEPEWKSYSFDAEENIFDFSKSENIIVIILDTFQSDIFQEIIDENGRYQEIFEGFTYYRNAAGGYPTTIASIPLILTGSYYKNEVPFDSYTKSSYESSSILKILKEEGYTIQVFEKSRLIYPGENILSNIRKPPDIAEKYPDVLYGITFFRFMPHFIKEITYSFTVSPMIEQGSQLDINFYRSMQENFSVTYENPVFKLYHLNAAHPPFRLNESMQYSMLPDNRTGYKEQSKSSLRISGELIKKLKESGIYNKSLIIIIGDHGIQEAAYSINTAQLKEADLLAYTPKNVVSGGIPLVLIKPINSYHPLEISDAPVSLSDIPATITVMLNISNTFPGIPIHKIAESENRTRFFYNYAWEHDSWDKEYLPPMTEYAISDFSWYGSSWRQTFQTFSSKGREIIPPPVYRVNSPINFGKEGNPVPYFISGWSSPEPAYTWTAERTATLAFTMDKPQSDLRIKLELFPFLIPGKLEEQRVIVYVNRQEIGSGTLSSGISEMSFLIPERSFDENIQYISFYLPDARSPDELGVSADRRTIGIGLRSLVLEDTNKQMGLSGPATPTETQ
jgi:hypothetical protein